MTHNKLDYLVGNFGYHMSQLSVLVKKILEIEGEIQKILAESVVIPKKGKGGDIEDLERD